MSAAEWVPTLSWSKSGSRSRTAARAAKCSGRSSWRSRCKSARRAVRPDVRPRSANDIVRRRNSFPLRAGPGRNPDPLCSIGPRQGERTPALSRRRWSIPRDRVRRRCWRSPRQRLLRRGPPAWRGFGPGWRLAPPGARHEWRIRPSFGISSIPRLDPGTFGSRGHQNRTIGDHSEALIGVRLHGDPGRSPRAALGHGDRTVRLLGTVPTLSPPETQPSTVRLNVTLRTSAVGVLLSLDLDRDRVRAGRTERSPCPRADPPSTA